MTRLLGDGGVSSQLIGEHLSGTRGQVHEIAFSIQRALQVSALLQRGPAHEAPEG
jgi:hypothetical protein